VIRVITAVIRLGRTTRSADKALAFIKELAKLPPADATYVSQLREWALEEFDNPGARDDTTELLMALDELEELHVVELHAPRDVDDILDDLALVLGELPEVGFDPVVDLDDAATPDAVESLRSRLVVELDQRTFAAIEDGNVSTFEDLCELTVLVSMLLDELVEVW
jgi:hypothetical protein